MEKSIIQTYKGQLRISSWDLAERLKIQHRYFVERLRKYRDLFECFGKIDQEYDNSRIGRPRRINLLNRHQVHFMILLSIFPRSSDQMLEILHQIIDAYSDCETDTEYLKFIYKNIMV